MILFQNKYHLLCGLPPFEVTTMTCRDSPSFLAHESVILLSARSMIFLKSSRPNTACILAGSTLDLCTLSGFAI